MGYFGYSYFVENRTRLNAVQVGNPKTDSCVTPNEKSVHEQTYKPLSRPLFIYVKGASLKKRHVQAFIDYMFDNEVRIADRARFISLTPKQLKRARHHFHFQLLKLRTELRLLHPSACRQRRPPGRLCASDALAA